MKNSKSTAKYCSYFFQAIDNNGVISVVFVFIFIGGGS